MDLRSVTYMSYSPGGHVRAVIQGMANCCTSRTFFVDLSAAREPLRRSFSGQDALVIGFSSNDGHIARPLVERLAYIKGNQSPAVVVIATRDGRFGSSLTDASEFLTNRGFVIVGGASFTIGNRYRPSPATGLPEPETLKDITDFSQALFNKLASISYAEAGSVRLPDDGDAPKKLEHIVPTSSKRCNRCGRCARICPTGAIDPDDPKNTDPALCVSCFACIDNCPNGSRTFRLKDRMTGKYRKIRQEAATIDVPETWL